MRFIVDVEGICEDHEEQAGGEFRCYPAIRITITKENQVTKLLFHRCEDIPGVWEETLDEATKYANEYLTLHWEEIPAVIGRRLVKWVND